MIRIYTLGRLSVRGDDGSPLTGAAAQPRRMAILALLARAGERGVAREKVLSLLWPDADTERGPRTLAQALYALRKDLGAEEAITGAKELRLDPALVTSDAMEFASAISRGDDRRAAELYGGPFLDGFHISGADEFERWIERERAVLAQDHVRALESLARRALAAGNASESVGWWRQLAALEPLNARVTVGLMEALTAAGDRAGAIKHARVYELLVEQELDLPPDREVMAVADRLRQESDEAARDAAREAARAPAAVVAEPAAATLAAPAEGATADAPEQEQVGRSAQPTGAGGLSPVAEPVGPLPPSSLVAAAPPRSAVAAPVPASAVPKPLRPRSWAVAALAVVGVVAIGLFAVRGRVAGDDIASGSSAGAVVAVGRIASYGTDSSAATLVGPVSDLLATSLARAPGLRVVSPGRMLELMRRAGAPGDSSAGGFVDAARRAGASEVIDGTLYARHDGTLRLDLRRTDLATGAIGGVQTIEGADLFVLVDSGTARLVAALGSRAPTGSVADVTTRSVTAYRMYQQGIDAYFRQDYHSALRLFDGALAEDPLFALAAYYGALAATAAEPDSFYQRIERAKRLAVRAPDRQRLTILADWAHRVSSPALRSIAETLATRYPSEIEGHLYTGIALVNDGEFLAARGPLERVVAMDSLGVGSGITCGVCAAMQGLVSAYALADSLPAAERVARRWLRLQPRALPAVTALLSVLELQGDAPGVDSLLSGARTDRPYDDVIEIRALHLIRIGDYAAADQLLSTQARQGSVRGRIDAHFALAMSLREQGRLSEALEAARGIRPIARRYWPNTGSLHAPSLIEAQVQLESDRPAIAAALFDSLSRLRAPGNVPSQAARHTAWMLTHAAGARAAAGDTAMLARLADSVRALGAQSGYGRDRRLHHHIRGLLLIARGDDASAIEELRSAIYSLTGGYTRTSVELAGVLLRVGRPREAVAVLQPVLRGPLDGANLYANRTEVHELLARAWDAAGVRDSAVAHYQIVARAWAAGDPPFRARADSARVRASRRS